MEANVEEALRAKEIAEKRFAERDFVGAKNYALKAKTLCPGLDGISQMVATFDVYVASEGKVNGALDYYSILGLNQFADKDAVKKQYRKMAVLLHPDKNKTVGADGAFKLVSEAWTKLSDGAKTGSYGKKRKKQMASAVVQTNLSDLHNAGVTSYSNSNSSTTHGRLDTFWTVCTSCKVQYEYLRKYVNKRLSCKNCRGIFIAVETGTAPVNGSFPYSPWPYVSNGHGSHGYDRVTYVPANGTYYTGNGYSGYHSGHGHEYSSNISFEWNLYSTASTGLACSNGPSNISADGIYQANGNIDTAGATVRSRSNGRQSMKSDLAYTGPSLSAGCAEPSGSGATRPEKKRKMVVGAYYRNRNDKKDQKAASEVRVANGNVTDVVKQPCPSVAPTRRSSNVPAFDMRKMLIDKARSDIQKKLEEMKLASEAAAIANRESAVGGLPREDAGAAQKLNISPGSQLEQIKRRPVSLTVPDSDFHDFDKDRSEECFKAKQIWALYDEDDGMPRLYCLIREVISVTPFKIYITYLNSKTDTEFGTVNWLDSGFTKSCGHFRAWNSDVVDQVNIFSHVLGREKAGRGGCVRIFPRSGDIWAMYQNWSPDWDRSTPDEVRHQYEMVEVIDDYSEELGIRVITLTKLSGFKTVYQRNSNKDAIRRVPRREMVRFSHQVPSWLLKGEECNLPAGCWDLDSAAIPEELLNTEAEAQLESNPGSL